MSGFLPIDVIRQVKIRPGIYNKDAIIPPRREQRQQLWMEVAESVTPTEEWERYTQEEKEARVVEVSNKWRNLRDHFYREIKLIEAGDSNKKRKYIYFDEMEFVRPYIGYKLPPVNKRAKKEIGSLGSTQECDDNDTDIDMESFLKPNEKTVKHNSKVTSNKKLSRSQSKTIPVIKRSLRSRQNKLYRSDSTEVIIDNFDVLKKTDGAKNPTFKIRESDISFCLSLVPTLRQLAGTRKLRAKIDILKVLHENLEQIEYNYNNDTDADMESEKMIGLCKKELFDKRDPLNDSDKKSSRKDLY